MNRARAFPHNGVEGHLKPTPPAGADDRIQALGAQAQQSLDGGRFDEAALLYERMLAHDPGHEQAQRGLERARSLGSEAARRHEAALHAADEALARGDRETARRTLEELLEAGADRDGIAARLEKLDDRRGLVTLGATSAGALRREIGRAALPARHLSRHAFATFWCLLVLSLAASVAFSWDRLVSRLVEAPLPSARLLPPAAPLAGPTAGERALADARQGVEKGDVTAALLALDRIAPGDAEYPFARQLRERLAQGEPGQRELAQ